MSTYDPEEKKEIWTHEEALSLVRFAYAKCRTSKYISVFLAGLFAPVITLKCIQNIDHPSMYLVGAVASVAIFYVLDSTYDFLSSAIREKENDENEN